MYVCRTKQNFSSICYRQIELKIHSQNALETRSNLDSRKPEGKMVSEAKKARKKTYYKKTTTEGKDHVAGQALN